MTILYDFIVDTISIQQGYCPTVMHTFHAGMARNKLAGKQFHLFYGEPTRI